MSTSPDVLVVGGGVIGLAVAVRLRHSGLAVTLLDRSLCGREASWAGAGIVAPANPHRSDPLYRIHCASLDLYPRFCEEITEWSGVDPQYRPCGALSLLATEQSVQMAASDVRIAKNQRTPNGDPVLELLTPDQIPSVEPAVTGRCLSALHCRRTAQVRNPRLLKALRGSCDHLGVEIHEHTAVTSLVVDNDRVTGVDCDRDRFTAKWVVMCAGAWSARIRPDPLAKLLPVHPVRGQIVLVKTAAPLFQRVIHLGKRYLVCRDDGHVLIGATTEPEAGFDKRNSAKAVNELMTMAMSAVPAMADSSVIAMWSGLRPGSPDMRPMVGPVPGYTGLIAATGHYRSGLTLAPVTADIVQALITQDQCPFDLSRCAPGRRYDRS